MNVVVRISSYPENFPIGQPPNPLDPVTESKRNWWSVVVILFTRLGNVPKMQLSEIFKAMIGEIKMTRNIISVLQVNGFN